MDAYGAYAQQAASTASPAQLVAMLYDGALARVEAARVALSTEPQDLGAANTALGKAQAIVTELTATLDHERGGAVAASLASLYGYCSAQLVAANIGKQAAPLDDVTAVLSQLRDAWAEACLPAAAAVAG
jgi:flagellar protein FliS